MTPKEVFEWAMAIILIVASAGAMGGLLFLGFKALNGSLDKDELPSWLKKKEKNDAQR